MAKPTARIDWADEIREWTAANERAREEYRTHPTIGEWCGGKCSTCRKRASTAAAKRMQAMRERRAS